MNDVTQGGFGASENNFFLISNSKKLSNFSKNFIYLFVYCFTENSIIKNRKMNTKKIQKTETNKAS